MTPALQTWKLRQGEAKTVTHAHGCRKLIWVWGGTGPALPTHRRL